MGKFLTNLLNPLTQNDHSVKDSFEASIRIQNISPTLFEQGYVFVSFDVVSLFTNLSLFYSPLDRTIKIILNRIYEDKLITTTLKKRTMKKLITDVCKKTAFSFNANVHKQTDGVSMGSSLGPVIANIFMTELEKFILDELINDNIVKFYIRYVDDTSLLVKPEDTDKILKKFNSYDKNIQFTVDKFLNGNVHFLDITDINADIYFKTDILFTIKRIFTLKRHTQANIHILPAILFGDSKLPEYDPYTIQQRKFVVITSY